MLSNGDPAVSMVVIEDVAVVIASDDNDGDMQASAKSKRKRQKHQSRIDKTVTLPSIAESASAQCVASGTLNQPMRQARKPT
jgi:hypothetical protein